MSSNSLFQNKSRIFVFVFLAFCVASSKNLLIYNEETLVALSFFCFLWMISHYFGNTIKDSFQERSVSIQHELHNFLDIKSLSFQELLGEHQKVAGLVGAIKSLDGFTTRELHSLNSQGSGLLLSLLKGHIHHKFKTLLFSKIMVQQKLQTTLSENILDGVLLAFGAERGAQPKSGRNSRKSGQDTLQKALSILSRD